MRHAIALSRLARTLFHGHLTGEPTEVTPGNLSAYRNLVRAGLMDGETSFHLTEEGFERRWEFLPHADGPSASALRLLSRLLSGERVEASDETRSDYRELAASGIMMACHTFAGGDESLYRFTPEGWEHRFKYVSEASIVPLPAKSA